MCFEMVNMSALMTVLRLHDWFATQHLQLGAPNTVLLLHYRLTNSLFHVMIYFDVMVNMAEMKTVLLLHFRFMNSLPHVMVNFDVMVNMAEMNTVLLLHSRLMNSLLHVMVNMAEMKTVL